MMIRRFSAAISMLLALCLVAGACSDSDGSALGDGSLGIVTVNPGGSIHIRSISALDPTGPGERDYFHIVKLAVEDYGPIRGSFTVEVGDGIDDGCSADAGPVVAEAALAGGSTVGVIGPSCSSTATTAVPLIAAEGLVMISMSNTSPFLTSDLAGNPGEHYRPGYFRTAHNDLYQGEAVAAFLHNKIGPHRVAVVHEGDAYTRGLAEAFRGAFERHGGTITHFIEADSNTADWAEVLSQIAAGDPDAVFIPLSWQSAIGLVQGLSQNEAFDDTVLVAGDAVLHYPFMSLPISRGVFIAGPDLDFGDNDNEATGTNAEQAAQRFEHMAGTRPSRAFWAHAYDATTLLLQAVEAASRTDGGTLIIDRAGIREHLDQVAGFRGIIGDITCDGFGDCGLGKITIIEHLHPDNPEASRDNTVYRFSPQPH
ncbi:ABC transporter substrate-binding protein [Candidatus Poribacteria bacterium]|nr:ABC transporter substrate-binding protein [Acidimicrobiia bacterium]MYK97147.1 ABC transporter substrate-binding protein [Candidatus Poribacteria bacterium]